ncbi:MAG: bifunctional methylenetetrahydrofolate dehydrogenase/methenyltetrahydrofolate cyclohydrolase, partial [Myxococcota bacterium]
MTPAVPAALAQTIRGEIANEVQSLIDAGHRAPCLAVVLVGDDSASRSYIKGKQRACARVNMTSVEHLLPADTTEDGLLKLIDELNHDDSVDGILVQLPLPKGISAEKIAEATSPEKDADGIHPLNAGRLLA